MPTKAVAKKPVRFESTPFFISEEYGVICVAHIVRVSEPEPSRVKNHWEFTVYLSSGEECGFLDKEDDITTLYNNLVGCLNAFWGQG